MPITINTIEDQDLTVFVLEGTIHTGEPCDALVAFYAGQPTTKALWDFSGVTSGQITSDELRHMFDHTMRNRSKRQRGMTAFVGPRDYVFGVARLSTTIGQLSNVPVELQAFRELGQAAEWLGVRYPTP